MNLVTDKKNQNFENKGLLLTMSNEKLTKECTYKTENVSQLDVDSHEYDIDNKR